MDCGTPKIENVEVQCLFDTHVVLAFKDKKKTKGEAIIEVTDSTGVTTFILDFKNYEKLAYHLNNKEK